MALLTVLDDERGVATEAAERVTTLVERAIAGHGNAMVCLTGGSTPKRLYALLADEARPWRRRIDWARVHLFWGDERHVPPGHADSNFGMARQALIQHVPVPENQVHRMRGELADARDAARAYEQVLPAAFTAAGRADLTFDVMLLGLGEDAHIASIFPGSRLFASIDVTSAIPRDAEAVWASHLEAWRITLTPPVLLDARAILMIVAGGTKAEAVDAALQAPDDLHRWPAQLLRPAGDRVEWILDRAAARLLRDVPGGT